MNQVLISGNLCKDNEVRYTTTGKPMTSGLIAASPHHPKELTQEQKDKETVFIGFDGFGDYPAAKGSHCTIIGELRQYDSTKYGCKMISIRYKEIMIKPKEVKQDSAVPEMPEVDF